MVRTRYAPSPTGYLHVGQIPTALFNYLFTRQSNGVFIVRIEDTDRERSKPEYEDAIFADLQWLGIEPDESPVHGGRHGPYRQTERSELYKKGIEKLLAEKKVFWCNHKSEEGSNTVFWCREDRESGGTPDEGIIRFKNPYHGESGQTLGFYDAIRGQLDFDPTTFGDFSIARKPDSPLYNFAVVIDDYEMGITDVIRGEDHVPNTPKQILLYGALGYEKPKYAHLPIVLATDRSKLSKRKGAMPIREYKEQGYLPEALINAMALIGWNPGDDREIFSKDELIKEFSLERVQKSGAIFDAVKLDWMNGEYIRKKSPQELVELCKPFLSDFLQIPNNYLEKIIALEQPRIKKLSEIGERVEYFFRDPEYDKELLRWKGMENNAIRESLDKSYNLISGFPVEKATISKEEIEKSFLEMIGAGDKGSVLWPLRVALTGKKASPGPFEILSIMPKEMALERIQSAIRMLA